MLFAVKYKVKVAGSDKVVMESPAPGLEFTLGEPGPNVIKAFVAAVKTMKRGEIVQLKIAPAYAYGEKVRAAMQRWRYDRTAFLANNVLPIRGTPCCS